MQYLGIFALLIVTGTMTRWFWRAWSVNVPKTPYLFQGLSVLALVLGIVPLYQGTGDPFAPWAVGLAVLFLYLTSTGAQKIDGTTVDVGDALPAFTALDENGDLFDSASLAGSGLLLKFFRGHW